MASRSEEIRIGMIGCDKRALWYSAIFDRIDPEIYADLDPTGYHHLTYYHLIELAHKRASGFRLAKVYDADRKAAERMAGAFGGRPEVCHRLAQVSDDVDLVFIANESGDGKDHPKLAKPGLEKKVPTFIDRPLARTVKDAKSLIGLAKRRRTPLLACSHLRLLPHAKRFKKRFDELPPIERGIVHGYGPDVADVADGLELAMVLFGDEFNGRVADVQSMGAWPLEVVLLTYAKLRAKRALKVLVTNRPSGGARHAFHASAASNFKPIYLDDVDAFIQSEGGLAVMNAIKRMVHSGESPVAYESMIETVAVAEAGAKSHNRGKCVRLKDLR